MQQQINALLEQSHTIAEHVRQNNWDLVQHLAEERQQALETFFSEPVPVKYVTQVTEMIQDILALDKQIVARINDEKLSALNSYRDMKSHNHARTTYQNIANYGA
jgi:hypothetical protein